MFRTALTDIARRGVPAVTGFFADRGKSLSCTGAALAVAGAGIATSAAATATPAAAAAGPGAATAVSHARPGDDGAGQVWTPPGRTGTARRLPPIEALDGMVAVHPATMHGSATSSTTPKAAPHPAVPHQSAPHQSAPHQGAPHQPRTHQTQHQATQHQAAAHRAPARPARVHVVRRSPRPTTWQQIQNLVARQTFPRAHPGALPSADRIQPVSASGPQAYMAITGSRMVNATTIVRRALARHMGLRSAVIAVATAMQESTLENISYGDRDSEGLFQQRPSAGWGSNAQITNPGYAADAFLAALHAHQQSDPAWASQPLWQSAQAVQNSGFPYAYAKWEAQAAQVVSSITRHMF